MVNTLKTKFVKKLVDKHFESCKDKKTLQHLLDVVMGYDAFYKESSMGFPHELYYEEIKKILK